MTRDYKHMPAPGDTIPCPKCRAPGGQAGEIRVRGVMTDQEYKDKRCNKCGHLWTVGDSLELPFEAHKLTTMPTKPKDDTPELARVGESLGDALRPIIQPGSTLDDGCFVLEPGNEDIPF